LPQYENIDLTKVKTSTKIIKDLYLTPLEVGQKVKMNNIFFETGKSTLKPNSFEELNKIANFLTDNNAVKIQIEGHTDNVGKPDANLKLSKWRARAVQQYLKNKGISEERVKFDGFGATKPVAKNNTPQGRSQNRRVEFNILAVD
jgi:outer membrane protein OmpA-like peptidoglycan-associated protein